MASSEVVEDEKMITDSANDSDSDRSSDESGSDDAENENTDEIPNEFELYEKQISEGQIEYADYLQYIGILKRLAEQDKAREHQEKISDIYAIPPDIWLTWIKEDWKEEDVGFERALNIRKKAVEVFHSVELWLELIQLAITKSDKEEIRQLFEKALTPGGLHTTKGSLLWDVYRTYESNIEHAKVDDESLPNGDIGGTPSGGPKGRSLDLLQRQLFCPLLNMEKTYEEYEKIRDKFNAATQKSVERNYGKAKRKLEEIMPYEDRLEASNIPEERMDCYRAYISYETSRDNPARVESLYERAIAECGPSDSHLWLEYVDYLDRKLGVSEVALKAASRATRACFWAHQLWQRRLTLSEKAGASFEAVKEVLEKGISQNFGSADAYCSLWMAYAEYLRRRAEADPEKRDEKLDLLGRTINTACESLAEAWGLDGDPNCQLLQFWARCEAIHRKNLPKFRQLWSDILSMGHNKTASMWLEYITLERFLGDSKHLRKLFLKALNSATDWPECIGNAWLNYERDHGTLESLEYCTRSYTDRMKRLQEVRAKEAEREAAAAAEAAEKKKLTKGKKKGAGRGGGGEKGGQEQRKENLKRKHETEGKWAVLTPGPMLQVPKKEGDESTPAKQQRTSESDHHGETVPHDPSKDNRTVFVSNLDYSVSEEKIREMFSPAGTLTDLRLVKDFKGRSKGYCYVEFETIEQAAQALKMDRQPVGDRPMFVSKCDPDRQTRRPVFRYSTNLEKNKLFIRGLPVTMTKEELEDMYKEFGTLKEVRLVTYRNGHSKGLAYVEFHDEAAAAHALIKTDGMTLSERTISVAISKPPERRTTAAEANNPLIPSLGGGPKEVGPRGSRGRIQSSLLPRALQISGGDAGSSRSSSVASSDGQDAAKPLSNSDFRQLLLGRKN